MPTMTVNKAIHCAARRDLRRFTDAANAFADGDAARAAALSGARDAMTALRSPVWR